MKSRNTLFLLFLAGGIFAYIWFIDRKRPTTRESMEHRRRVAAIDREKINTISIKNPDAKIELRRGDNGVWQLEEPVKDRADPMVVAQLLTSTETLKHDAVIGGSDKEADKDQIKEFGLSNADIKVKFAGSEKPLELFFGKDAAVEGKGYLRVEGSNTVYVVPNELKNQISKKADEFRDRKLTDLTVAQIERVAIKSASGEIEVEKKGGHWVLVKPLKARADDSKTGDLISQVTTARIDTFIGEPANPSRFGLEEPRGSVSLFSEGTEQPIVLQIGANPKDDQDKEKTYAKLSTRQSVILLPKAIEQLLQTKPNDLRDKHLVRVESDIVDRLTIEPKGEEKIVVARKGETWVRSDAKEIPVNSAAASRLLTDLQNQEVANFVTDVATESAQYGLDQPQLRVTLSSYASENTAETAAGEKPIGTVLFGKVEGENVYAKLDDEPFIVSVPKVILDSIPTDPVQWQELTIYKFKPDELTSVEITRAEQPTISVERAKDAWKLSKGDGVVKQINLQSLLNTLANLRAVRWVGPTTPEHGLNKPTVTVTFRAGEKIAGKLLVGSQTPDEMSFATAQGLTGTFAISRPDVEALRLEILEKPIEAAPAAQPVQPDAALPPKSTVPPSISPPTSASEQPTEASGGSANARPEP